MPTADESPKSRAALAAAALVHDGMIVGLGSGSTAALLIRRLGERIKQDGLKISAISTSDETTRLANSLGKRESLGNFAGVSLDEANMVLKRLTVRSGFRPLPFRNKADQLSECIPVTR